MPFASLIIVCISLCRTQYLLHILLEFRPGNQNTMLTSCTLNADIHPHTNDLHLIRTARVLFLHLYNISKLKNFTFHYPSPFFPSCVAAIWRLDPVSGVSDTSCSFSVFSSSISAFASSSSAFKRASSSA